MHWNVILVWPLLCVALAVAGIWRLTGGLRLPRPGGRKKLRNQKSPATPLAGAGVDKALREALEPVLLAWREADPALLPRRMDAGFARRATRAVDLLRARGLRRELLFTDAAVSKTGKGHVFEGYNEGGREWRRGAISAAALERYTESRTGRTVRETYYPRVQLTVTQSRRIRYADQKAAASREKKRGASQDAPFYEAAGEMVCPSCGARVTLRAQTEICPYCGGVLVSDFYDWQTEQFELESVAGLGPAALAALAGVVYAVSFAVLLLREVFARGAAPSPLWIPVCLLCSLAAGAALLLVPDGAEKRREKQIVRYAAPQLRSCVYNAVRDEDAGEDLLDLQLGEIRLLEVRHTEEETAVRLRFPVRRLRLLPDGGAAAQKELRTAWFARARYPDRLRSAGRIAYEKACPSCGANFTPDRDGCCAYCGYGLKTDNAIWRPSAAPRKTGSRR